MKPETKFTPRMTIGEKYGPAMEITDQGIADAYFERLVRHNLQCRVEYGESQDIDTAMSIERSNLGYFAGYYGAETRLRVEKLFACSHPIFGKAANGLPTVEQALAAGREMAQDSSVSVAADSANASS